jgi:hypothetical protein
MDDQIRSDAPSNLVVNTAGFVDSLDGSKQTSDLTAHWVFLDCIYIRVLGTFDT